MTHRIAGTPRTVPFYISRIDRSGRASAHDFIVTVWETCRGDDSRQTNYRGTLAATTSLESAEAAERLLTSEGRGDG